MQKLTRENVWHTDFIDNFHKLLTNHMTEIDFRLVGKFLDVASKIYDMRIETLYIDAVQTNRSLGVKKRDEPKTNDRGSNMHENDQSESKNTQNRKKFVIKRKPGCNVVRNLEILNKRLEVHSVLNPVFAKITSTVGNRSKNMLTNVLPTCNGVFTIPGEDKKFWDSNSCCELDTNTDLASVSNVEDLGAIRSSLETYRINSDPLESFFSMTMTTINLVSDDDEDVEMEDVQSCQSSLINYDSGYSAHTLVSSTQLDATNDFDMDVQYDGEASQDTFQDQSNESGILMMPTTAEEFEYAYQSQDDIENHWAGPSYWKFHRRKSLPEFQNDKKLKRHKSIGVIHVEDVWRQRFNDTDSLVKDSGGKLAISNIRYRRQTLPMDFDISPGIVDRFGTSKNLDIYAPIINEVLYSQDFDENEDFGMETEDIFEVEPSRNCQESTRMPENNFESQTSLIRHSEDYGVDFQDSLLEAPSFQNVKESTQLPENFSSLTIEDSQINFTPKFTSSHVQINKPTNIKVIKNMNQTVLESERNLDGSNEMRFSELAEKTSKLLSGMHTSTALIFQAVLHQTNEEKVEIISEFNNIDDFTVSLK